MTDREYVTVTGTHHPVRVTVPADDGWRDPYPYNNRFPPDPCCFVWQEPIDCAELDQWMGR